jgi:hypothetical protein
VSAIRSKLLVESGSIFKTTPDVASIFSGAVKKIENDIAASPQGQAFSTLQKLEGKLTDIRAPWERYGTTEAAIFRRVARNLNDAFSESQLKGYADGWADGLGINKIAPGVPLAEKIEAHLASELRALDEDAANRVRQRVVDFMSLSAAMRFRLLEAETPEKQEQFTKYLASRRSEISKERRTLQAELRALNISTARLTDMREVVEFIISPSALERAQESWFYKLYDALRSETLFRICKIAGRENPDETILTERGLSVLKTVPEIFVIQHDWQAALGAATEIENAEWRLPSDQCVFEFQFIGHRVVVFAQAEEGVPQWFHLFVRCKDNIWFEVGSIDPDEIAAGGNDGLSKIVLANVRAICIALDAEVAEKQVVRASHLTNERRKAEGRLVLSDFHTVTLARRARVKALECGGAETGRKVRLHFRRGHWRHFQAHKTWIKWMLVGNPDLGFINKQYQL